MNFDPQREPGYGDASRSTRRTLSLTSLISLGVLALALVTLLWAVAVTTTRHSEAAWTGQIPAGAVRVQHPEAAEVDLIEPEGLTARTAGEATILVDPAWVSDQTVRTGVSGPALKAYASAAVRLGREQSDCGLGWTTLAGIGWVESGHGTVGGRTLLKDGHSDRTIVGPALNGRGEFAAIRSHSSSVRWHGDTTWDHAVGPMQFIGSTWDTWASDGDGDGVTDPTDIDDAAYAAGRYLCASGSLGGAGWSRAIWSYNHSEAYVRQVWAAADSYAKRAATGG